MNRCGFVIAALLAVGCASPPNIDALLASTYEIKMISSGNNGPQINLWRNNLRDVLVLLHHRVPPDDIRAHFGWTVEEWHERLDTLVDHDFLRQSSIETYVPTSMVITRSEGEELRESARPVAVEIADLLARKQEEIRGRVRAIPAFSADLPAAPFFVMSDVILDNWQIQNVEREFLQADRTLRHGMNYYHSIQEKDPDSDVEAFGIYGNQMWERGSLLAGIYGNARSTSRNLLSLTAEDFTVTFGIPKGTDPADARARIMMEIVSYARGDGAALSQEVRNGLQALGLFRDGRLQLFVFSSADYEELSGLAAAYTPDIVQILEASKEVLREEYAASRYAEEITFEEYVIWWYHFMYSEATEILAERGVITLPASGVVTYVVDLGEEE